MTAVLHRLGYRYKKPKLVPGKADAERQEAFVEDDKKRKETKGEDDVMVAPQSAVAKRSKGYENKLESAASFFVARRPIFCMSDVKQLPSIADTERSALV